MESNLFIYTLRRILILIPVLLVISIIIFIIIQLPPGDIVSTKVQALEKQGARLSQEQIQALRAEYGLDKPMYVRYLMWIKNFVTGDLGRSFTQSETVNKLIMDRLPLTLLISFLSILLSWLIAIPVSLLCSVRQYSVGDYFFTFLAFLGMSIPTFFTAIILMYYGFTFFGISIGGLFSREFITASWSFAKVIDMLKHIWVPIVVLGVGGTAVTIRTLRAVLLDELGKDYVRTARAKGIPEWRVLVFHPLRVSIIPLLSTIGWLLPTIVSGDTIVSKVLSIPTIGPLMLEALLTQDMYLAGSLLFCLSILTVIGTLVSDLLMAWLDPRLKYN